jgi:excisionase family DNA binding protein
MTQTPTPTRPVRSTRYLTTSEVAEILQVAPKTVSRWAKEGKLPHGKTMGGHCRFPEREIRTIADALFQAATVGEAAR